MIKALIAVITICTTGFAGASNSFITNFSSGYYITPTAGSVLTTPLNQYFHVDAVTNTNLLWVSTDTQYGGFLMELLPTNAPKTVATSYPMSAMEPTKTRLSIDQPPLPTMAWR
jgi:hypothetical protein